jgi:hypothetical protein
MIGVFRGERRKRAESSDSVLNPHLLLMDGHTLKTNGHPAPLMRVFIDLFCGLGGASEAFLGGDWRVIRIDNNPDLLDHVKGMWLLDMKDPKAVLDVIAAELYNIEASEIFIWASPPCTDFSTKNVAKNAARSSGELDLTLLKNTKMLINWLCGSQNVTGFIIENVKGAVTTFNKELGPYAQRIGPFFLWGRFVPIACITAEVHRHRKPFNSTNSRTPLRSNIHAKIPYGLSESLRLTLERQLSLLRWVE